MKSLEEIKESNPALYEHYRLMARMMLEKSDARPDHIHHIDLDRRNNNPENLVKCRPTRHNWVHTELWRQAVNAGLFEPRVYIKKGGRRQAHTLLSILIKKGVISFDRQTLTYDFGIIQKVPV